MPKTTNIEDEPQYSYKQLIAQTTGFEQSILRRVLNPTKKYTLTQAKDMVQDFLNKEVN